MGPVPEVGPIQSYRPGRWPFLDWPHPIPFAHRGGGAEWPENTMLAFESAVRLGYRYLETDVHATSDGTLVAVHDHQLDRVADRPGTVADLTWAEVSSARVQGQPIPRLEDILGAWPDIRVNVDAKHDAAVEPLVSAVQRHRAEHRACIGSFSSRRASRLRQLSGNQVCTWMGRSEIVRLRLASLGLPVPAFGAACAQLPPRIGAVPCVPLVDRRLLNAARLRGLAVHVWTVNDRAEMTSLLDLGVEGIFSDRPSLLREVLVERGQWQ